ncbi:MAG: type II toxin-antitoxin system VapC family toxin [Xanthobacteraceae bacterium]|nr:type II toxin-antitoxin system VapC family toxin [Xanthobacteraceae bacterium]
MIVVDTSAIFAIAAHEPERDLFIEILNQAEAAICSGVTYVETVMVLTGRSRILTRSRVDELLGSFALAVAPTDLAVTGAAADAFERYGKGRHRASLNLADCFAYALAKSRNAPLLYKGGDFARTDIEPAWTP